MRLFEFGIGFVVVPTLPGVLIAGKQYPDFPPTPRAPEIWCLGCVQNVIRQSISVTWINDSGAQVIDQQTFGSQMLDADAHTSIGTQHLPFVRLSNDPFPPSRLMLAYGRGGSPLVGAGTLPPLPGPGPAWGLDMGYVEFRLKGPEALNSSLRWFSRQRGCRSRAGAGSVKNSLGVVGCLSGEHTRRAES